MAKFLVSIFSLGVIVLVNSATIPETSQFVTMNRLFSVDFFKELLKNPNTTGKNIVFSPYSIQTVGALLYAGADGITASEMISGFHLPSSDATVVGQIYKSSIDKSVSNPFLKIANKIYVANGYSIAPSYKEIATQNFNSDIENVDFTKSADTARYVNKWIDENTNGKIKNVLRPDDINADTKMLIANAIAFKGAWNQAFKKEYTTVRDFHSAPGNIIQTEMMTGLKTKFKFGTFPELGVKVAEYPFKDSDISMGFMLPDSIDKSVDQVESKLYELIGSEEIFNRLGGPRTGKLILPKFKIEYSVDLTPILSGLGMSHLFSTGIQNVLTPPKPIAVTKAIHKAFIDVNEEGAEAVAVTVVVGTTYSASRPNYELFEIKQSFLYFIRGGNGEIYFMGRYTGKN